MIPSTKIFLHPGTIASMAVSIFLTFCAAAVRATLALLRCADAFVSSCPFGRSRRLSYTGADSESARPALAAHPASPQCSIYNKMNPDLERLQAYPFNVGRPGHRTAVHPRRSISPSANRNIAAGLHRRNTDRPFTRSRPLPSTQAAKPCVTIAAWLQRRAACRRQPRRGASCSVNGTREALFALAQCLIDRSQGALVLMPNPFYRSGARPCRQRRTRLHSLPAAKRLAARFRKRAPASGGVASFCTSARRATERRGDGTATAAGAARTRRALRFRHRSDNAAEIYGDEDRPPPVCRLPPPGNTDYRRCVVFHSCPSAQVPDCARGFVAGDAMLIERFLRYRTYHCCAMPLPPSGQHRGMER